MMLLEVLQDPSSRRDTDSTKWTLYPPDVLPLWVADMDFRVPQVITDALRERVEEGIFGYTFESKSLRDIIADRVTQRHKIPATPEDLVFTPPLVYMLYLMERVFAGPGKPTLMSTPIYPPFLNAVKHAGGILQDVPLVSSTRDGALYYEIDFDALEAAITPDNKLLMLCSPHNPVGRVFTRSELTRVAELAERHNLIVVADEIHGDLVFNGHEHIALASLSPEIAQRTITLNAPSKTFNVPGLQFSFAVISNPVLRQRVMSEMERVAGHSNMMGFVAAKAAYQHGQPWLDELLVYLRANRDALVNFMRTHLPQLPITVPEGTYLAWIDARALNVESPYKFFLEQAKVALMDGEWFGEAGKGFVRLNFGCSSELLMKALDQMRAAVTALSARG